MGGEQEKNKGDNEEENGSSPHGRGTEHVAILRLVNLRFIPAWAGNRY